MKKTALFLLLLLGLSGAFGQVSVSSNGTSPDPSAMLDIQSDRLGFLPPRVDSLNVIQNPASGLTVYHSPSKTMKYWNGSEWVVMASSGHQTPAVLDTTVQVTTEELLNLHFGLKECIPAPGPEKFANVLSVWGRISSDANFEIVPQDLIIIFGEDSILNGGGGRTLFFKKDIPGVFDVAGGNTLCTFSFQKGTGDTEISSVHPFGGATNQPVCLSFSNRNSNSFAGGTGKLDLKFLYTIEEWGW